MVRELLLIRHGESEGNVAATAAQAAGAELIQVGQRDADVPLTAIGQQQAQAFGSWLQQVPAEQQPDFLWCSPYVRARQTAQIALLTAGLSIPLRVDERIRDRELGVLDLLTAVGVEQRFPVEAERRRWLGKFYYRPPGGESWADVALRIRSLMLDIERSPSKGRVLVVAHDAIILLFRYVCEGLDEAQLLEITRTTTVLNASVTHLVHAEGEQFWRAAAFNQAEHLAASGAVVTQHAGDADVLPH